MAKKTNAELLIEVEKLQKEISATKAKMQDAMRSALNALDAANAHVARHLRSMQIEDSEPLPDDTQWS